MDSGPQYMQTTTTLTNKDIYTIRNYLDFQWTNIKFDQMKNAY